MGRFGLHDRMYTGIYKEKTCDTVVIHAYYSEKLCMVYVFETVRQQD